MNEEETKTEGTEEVAVNEVAADVTPEVTAEPALETTDVLPELPTEEAMEAEAPTCTDETCDMPAEEVAPEEASN